MRVGEARVARDRLLEVLGRALRVAALEHHVAEVVVRLGLPVVDRNGGEVELLRGVILPAPEEDVAEVGVCDGEHGVELDGAMVERLGLVVRRWIFVEGARAHVELVGGTRPGARRPRAKDADEVGAQLFAVEVVDELSRNGLERLAVVRADHDTLPVAHEPQLLERTLDAGRAWRNAPMARATSRIFTSRDSTSMARSATRSWKV